MMNLLLLGRFKVQIKYNKVRLEGLKSGSDLRVHSRRSKLAEVEEMEDKWLQEV